VDLSPIVLAYIDRLGNWSMPLYIPICAISHSRDLLDFHQPVCAIHNSPTPSASMFETL